MDSNFERDTESVAFMKSIPQHPGHQESLKFGGTIEKAISEELDDPEPTPNASEQLKL